MQELLRTLGTLRPGRYLLTHAPASGRICLFAALPDDPTMEQVNLLAMQLHELEAWRSASTLLCVSSSLEARAWRIAVDTTLRACKTAMLQVEAPPLPCDTGAAAPGAVYDLWAAHVDSGATDERQVSACFSCDIQTQEELLIAGRIWPTHWRGLHILCLCTG